MSLTAKTEKETDRWCRRSWLWVFLCAAAIFATVPVARRIQGFVYNSVGKEFFTYAVLFVIIAGLAAILYLLVFRLRVRKISQYVWLFTGAGLYVYFTLRLREHPEEAVHFLEYGALAYFLFRALSRRIRDRTIYITVILSVMFVGTLDEFTQWMMPNRYWDYRDVGINTLAGIFFSIITWKGIRPETISRPVRRLSIRALAVVVTLDLLFLGLCLSNTPDAVRRYTAAFEPLMWLRGQEVMTEFGHAHKDPEIGIFYSRLTIGELREHDMKSAGKYSKLPVDEITSPEDYEKLLTTHTRVTDPFMYEFLLHIMERDRSLEKFLKRGNQRSGLRAFKENLILEKYFGRTLRYFNAAWSREKRDYFKDSRHWLRKDYASLKGKRMITSFSLKTAWFLIIVILAAVWTAAELWRKRLKS